MPHSVAIPLYSALITEVSPYFSDQTVSFDHCNAKDAVYNEEPENSINYVLMDISSLCFENPDTLGTSVRTSTLDALQNELIEQNKKLTPLCWPRRPPRVAPLWPTRQARLPPRTPTRSARPCSRRCALIRRPETFDERFTPSDLNTETKRASRSPSPAAKDAPRTDPVTPDQPGTPEQPGKPEQPGTPGSAQQSLSSPLSPSSPPPSPKPGKSDTTTTVTTNKTNTKGGLPTTGDRFDGRMVAAFAIAGVAVISAGGYILYRRNKGVILTGAGGDGHSSSRPPFLTGGETPLKSFSKRFPRTLCCAIVQRNSNKVRPRHGITKGATKMKNTMKSLNNWWWRDANTIGRQ